MDGLLHPRRPSPARWPNWVLLQQRLAPLRLSTPHNFRRWRHVSFPEPLYPLVHPAVLIESFENGENVARFVDETEGNSRMKKDLAHIGTYAFLKMLLICTREHILVRLNESKNKRKTFFRSKPHIVFLDVGMIAELSVADRDNLKQFFKAVAVRDGRTAAKCTLKLSENQNCPNPAAFTEDYHLTRVGDSDKEGK
ncbi:hypothetical protein ZWY2020_027823 [Hordeum vulgare]|nr:hypothetical protein ZWY2020_027823 [Hordeum vulgare]